MHSRTTQSFGAAFAGLFAAALTAACTSGAEQRPASTPNATASTAGPSDTANGPGNQGGQALASQNAETTVEPNREGTSSTASNGRDVESNAPAARSDSFPKDNAPATLNTGPVPAPNFGAASAAEESNTDRTVDYQTAIHEIAAADCERLADCGKIGKNGKYETQTDCVLAEDRAEHGAIGPKVCREGIDRDKLDDCVRAVRTGDCKVSIDTLAACRSGKVCMPE